MPRQKIVPRQYTNHVRHVANILVNNLKTFSDYIYKIMIRSLCLFLIVPFINGLNVFSSTSMDRVKPVLVGSTKPIENFDPFNLGETEERFQYFREAELKHGRLAMVSGLSIPLIEKMTHTPAIHEFDKLPEHVQSLIISSMFVSEFSSMIYGWKNPFIKENDKNYYFKLNEDYQPGDYGFSLVEDLTDEKSITLLNKELNNGRLAMIGSLGVIVQELITNKPIF